MTQAKLMSAEDLGKLILNIGKSGMKLNAQIQLAAVACIGYSIIDRNITPGMELYANLTAGARKDALVAYFEKYGQFAWSSTDKKLVFFDVAKHTGKVVDFTPEYETLLMSKPWTSAKSAPEITSKYDFAKEADKFVERFTKLALDPTKEVKGKELLATLVNAINEYQYGEWKKTNTAPTDEMIHEELETLPRVRVA